MLLAIDTATRLMSIALYDGEGIRAEKTWHTANRHTIELTPSVREMMDACDVRMEDLTGLAVATGPGSYTGVRIGAAFVKGLAQARSLPIVGMTTLDILAAAQPQFQNSSGLIAVVQAGRGRIIVNTYRWRKGEWASRGEPRLMDWETMLNNVDGPAYISGELNQMGIDAITEAQSREVPVHIAAPAHRLRRAGFLAGYAWEKLQAAGDDKSAYAPAKLVPIYVSSDDNAS